MQNFASILPPRFVLKKNMFGEIMHAAHILFSVLQ